MKRLGLLCVSIIVSALTSLFVNFPLAWAAHWAVPEKITPTVRFDGTIWTGFVRLPANQGMVQTKIHRRRVLSGGPPLSFNYQFNGVTISGFAGSDVLQDVVVISDLERLRLYDERAVGLSGILHANIKEAFFDTDCTQASGSMTIRDIRYSAIGAAWRAPDLMGPIRCEAGQIIADMAGEAAGDDLRILFGLKPTGQYTMTVKLRTMRSEADQALPVLGFEQRSGIWHLRETGSWR